MIKLMSRSLVVSFGLLLLAAAVPLYIFASATPPASAPAEEKVVTDTGYVVFRIGAKDAVVKGPNVAKFAAELPKRPAAVEGASVITMDAAPFIENDRTYVPVRYLANALGVADANVKWNAGARLVTLAEPGFPTVEMTIGEKRVTSNGKATATDVAPVIRDARTMLPAKWVAEALGYTVEWDAQTKTVLAYKGARPSEEELRKVYAEFEVIAASAGKGTPVTPDAFPNYNEAFTAGDWEKVKQALAEGKPIPEDVRAKLEKAAANRGLTVEELIEYQKALEEQRPVPDHIRQKMSQYIDEKSKELLQEAIKNW